MLGARPVVWAKEEPRPRLIQRQTQQQRFQDKRALARQVLRQEMMHTPHIYHFAEMLWRTQRAMQPFRQRASQPGRVRGGKAEFALACAYLRRQNVSQSLAQDVFCPATPEAHVCWQGGEPFHQYVI